MTATALLPDPAHAALAAAGITIRVPPPGPRARAYIDAHLPCLSPSLIFVYPLVAARAAGCMVEDVDGNVYLDCQAGVAAAATGHAHPAVAAAIARQAHTLIHLCGTDFHYEGYGALARRLDAGLQRLEQTLQGAAPSATPRWQTFLTNSGTEAVEAAIKLARHHTGRTQIIAFRGGFHGRTAGSLSLTASKPKYRRRFGPLLPGVHHAEFGSVASIERELLSRTVAPDDVAAIVVEPIQGEGGYVLPPPAFLPELRALCDRHGILLVFDEVQSGMGRTGTLFAAEHFGVVPDLVALAKGLASGMPLGALCARRERMTWTQGTHGSTTGGNPVAIAAALATLDLLEGDAASGGGLLANARAVGDHLRARLRAALDGVPGVGEVRGLGLMIGVDFDSGARADRVAQRCFERGLLVLECGERTIRVSPPLLLSRSQADTAASLLAAVAREVAAELPAP